MSPGGRVARGGGGCCHHCLLSLPSARAGPSGSKQELPWLLVSVPIGVTSPELLSTLYHCAAAYCVPRGVSVRAQSPATACACSWAVLWQDVSCSCSGWGLALLWDRDQEGCLGQLPQQAVGVVVIVLGTEITCWVWSGEGVLGVPGRLGEWEGKQVMGAGGKGVAKALRRKLSSHWQQGHPWRWRGSSPVWGCEPLPGVCGAAALQHGGAGTRWLSLRGQGPVLAGPAGAAQAWLVL